MEYIEKLSEHFLTHEGVMDRVKKVKTKCTWDYNTALGETMRERYESLYCKLVEVTNVLVKKGAKGLGLLKKNLRKSADT